MNELYKALDKKDRTIEALKVSNNLRLDIINGLVTAGVEKDKKIRELKLRIEELEGITERLRQ